MLLYSVTVLCVIVPVYSVTVLSLIVPVSLACYCMVWVLFFDWASIFMVSIIYSVWCNIFILFLYHVSLIIVYKLQFFVWLCQHLYHVYMLEFICMIVPVSLCFVWHSLCDCASILRCETVLCALLYVYLHTTCVLKDRQFNSFIICRLFHHL